jgi:hypothetical protein
MYAKELQIIFNQEIVNKDNPSDRFTQQTFHEVHLALTTISGVMFQFASGGPEYHHPWHLIQRVRIIR